MSMQAVAELRVGEIKSGAEIGKLPSDGRFGLVACPDCNKPRWVRLENGNHPTHHRCPTCAQNDLMKRTLAIERANWDGGSIEAPQIGDIRRAYEVGWKGNQKMLYHGCVDCGRPSWVTLKDVKKGGRPATLRCCSCSSRKQLSLVLQGAHYNYNWKGGRLLDSRGYVIVYITTDSPYFSMACARHRGVNSVTGYILEHRLIMAQELGRCLQANELVHHKNGIKTDNRPENLQLVVRDGHNNGFHGSVMVCPHCQKEFVIP